jgi:hypothetical protein
MNAEQHCAKRTCPGCRVACLDLPVVTQAPTLDELAANYFGHHGTTGRRLMSKLLVSPVGLSG